ncbi:MAG: glycosyltransferase family 1 protein [Candidatus Brocadiaceae bacterium]|nr:glycosyltransferase family 1 protein [Candidatus Brocadiaceae bacterium]
MNSNQKYLFISFTETKWDGHFLVRQKLMSEVSKSNKVVYVNPRKEIRAIFYDIIQCKKLNFGLKKINRNLLVIESPLIFPKIYKFNKLDNIIDRLYHLFIKLICAVHGRNCKKFLYIWEPSFSVFRKYYKKYDYIYHVYDLFSLYTIKQVKNYNKKSDYQNEFDLVQHAFLFYAVSNEICEYYQKKFERCPKLMPNATGSIYLKEKNNYPFLKEANNLFKNIPNTKIGYCGSLKGVLNLDIIIDSVSLMNNFSFVFIGKIIYTDIKKYDEKVDTLLSYNNVYHLGHCNVELLPYLLNRLDILMMIYGSNKDVWTYYSFPAKLYEYMAIGKPIISTPHPVVNEYNNLISIVDNYQEFVSVSNRLKQDPNRRLCSEMVEVAKKNKWSDRVNSLLNDIDPST